MSMKWPGGLIRKTPVTPAGPLQNGAAPGMWTLGEAAYWTKQGLWPTAGNFLAVEDVFSTYLYTGNGSAQTITNGIDLAGKGGMLWVKGRNQLTQNNIFDTVRGRASSLSANSTDAARTSTSTQDLTSFNSNGFSVGTPWNTNVNDNNYTFASWTFREAANFFDVVTYTGTAVGGVGTQTITHQLGSAPGTIIVKRTDSTSNWFVYHRSLGASKSLFMNTTGSENFSDDWNYVTPSATSFDVGQAINVSGGTYVAYLFAHDTSSTGLIQCGSFTTDAGGNFSVSLGWEPQFVMVKRTDAAQNWLMADTMRGFSQTQFNTLNPNLSNAEAANSSNYIAPNATGFGSIGNQFLSGSASYIYIAIRRGPMRTPTLGTSVFQPIARAGTGVANLVVNTTVRPDMVMINQRNNAASHVINDRLRGGGGRILNTEATDAETNTTLYTAQSFGNASYTQGTNDQFYCNQLYNYIDYAFTRAPSFFDEVCYTGTGSSLVVNHSLGVAPEFVIAKRRNGVTDWAVYCASNPDANGLLRLNISSSGTNNDLVYFLGDGTNVIPPTSTQLTLYPDVICNASGGTYVAYLFASCPGVSKVGSYTGTGALQTINCGFTTGARFVLIKRTDSTGDWYVWDSARGITSGNDPYLLLNSSAAEVTGTNYVDTTSVGFQVTAAAPAGINANGGSYIFLAVA